MPGQTPQFESLADLVTTQMVRLGGPGKSLSLRDVSERSRRRVSPETVRRLTRGEHGGNISDEVAQGLALALEVPLTEVYRIAGLPQPSGRWDWPRKYERLSVAQRALVEDVAQGLLNAYEQGRRDAGR